MTWRVLPLETHDAFTNLAIDEAILESVSEGSQPTIRFYNSKPFAVSLGFFQSIWDVDLHRCRQYGLDVTRRHTEGDTLYHDDGISYSVIAPEIMFPKNVADSYRFVSSNVINSLKILGINAKFEPMNSVVVNGYKISVGAQARMKGVLLHQGTVFYESTPPFPLKSLDKIVRLKDFGNFGMQTVYHAMVQGFTAGRQVVLGHKTAEEMERTRKLLSVKYSTHEWIVRR
jgi:lipoate-protein ligase A